MADGKQQWEEDFAAGRERRESFSTLSFEEVPPLGLPTDGEVPEQLG